MFDHEKLRVYQEAMAFASWTEAILERTKKSSSLHDQLDRARTSILLNIAEGNGRFTSPDRCRFFDTARGSVLECAACLDLLAVTKVIDQNSADRLHEAPISYRESSKMNYD